MNLSHIRIFVAVVTTGSFTKAAELLDLTQSGVSHAISSLEKSFETKLLIRERNGIAVTESGEKILYHSKQVLQHMNSISEEAKKFSNFKKGKLRIGSLPSASMTLLPKVLASFQKKYPNVEIVLFEGNAEEIMDWLNNATIDLAVTTDRNSSFDNIPIIRDPFLAVLPINHPLAKSPQIDIWKIKNEAFIMPKGGCQSLIIEAFAKLDISPNIQYSVQDMNTIFSMVQEGLGWTIVPQKSIPVTTTSVISISINPSIWRDIGIVVPPKSNSSEICQAFISEAKKVFQLT